MSDSLAVRLVKNSQLEPTPSPASGSTSLARVSQVLDTFAARDSNGETLTAVRHYPAREAQWAEFPEWIRRPTCARRTPPRAYGSFTPTRQRRWKRSTRAKMW